MTDPEIEYHFENVVMLAEKLAAPGLNPIIHLTTVASAYIATLEFVRTQLAGKPTNKVLN
jgi:hypothetical protein